MADTGDDSNAYELLEIETTATEGEIKKAYRQKSLKVHPDRHPNNPLAAQKFHELNNAYELLLDPIRKTALDTKLNALKAKKVRHAAYDNKRKAMMDELEKSERDFKKTRTQREEERANKERDEERIKEEGRKMMRERQEAMMQKEIPKEAKGKERERENVPPSTGPLDTTVRLKYTLTAHPTLTTPTSLATLLSPFGIIDDGSIILSIKPNKKNPSKPGKNAIAVVPFAKVEGAFAAVMASGRTDKGMDGIEIGWADAGKEPELVKWLREKGRLGGEKKTSGSKGGGAFSSFPDDLFTAPAKDSPSPPPTTGPPGLDLESVTFMRMRQAERERLEREILEADAKEEMEG